MCCKDQKYLCGVQIHQAQQRNSLYLDKDQSGRVKYQPNQRIHLLDSMAHMDHRQRPIQKK